MSRCIFTVTNDLTYDQRMIRICRSLTANGFEVILTGRALPSSQPLKKEPFRQIRLQCFFHKGKWFYLEYNLRLLFFLLSQRFDFVCSVDLDTLLPGFLACRWKRKVCVYDAHEYFTEVPEVVRRPGIQKAWALLARYLIPRIEYCYTVSESLARVFEEQYHVPFRVIRNVPHRQTAPVKPERPEKPVLLYQGVLNEGRGLEEAIEVMRSLPQAELWLAGEGDLSHLLRDLAREKGVDDQVRFMGYVDPENLKTLTPKATIGLNLLHHKGLSYYYSLANKAFDYIQAGIPSLQMDFPEYRSLQDQFGIFILIRELNPPRILEAIQRLLNDPFLYSQLQDNCRKAREILVWEEEEKKLLEFYRTLPFSPK